MRTVKSLNLMALLAIWFCEIIHTLWLCCLLLLFRIDHHTRPSVVPRATKNLSYFCSNNNYLLNASFINSSILHNYHHYLYMSQKWSPFLYKWAIGKNFTHIYYRKKRQNMNGSQPRRDSLVSGSVSTNSFMWKWSRMSLK